VKQQLFAEGNRSQTCGQTTENTDYTAGSDPPCQYAISSPVITEPDSQPTDEAAQDPCGNYVFEIR
jgi:hypothetical protein